MERKIKLCDYCQATWQRQTVATRSCITCGCDLCHQDSCDSKGYFDKFIPYNLEKKMTFCPNCCGFFKKLSAKDFEEGFLKEKWLSKGSFAESMNGFLQKLMNESYEQIRVKAEDLFSKAIQKSKEKYSEEAKIEAEKLRILLKEAMELQKKIDELERKRKSLLTTPSLLAGDNRQLT